MYVKTMLMVQLIEETTFFGEFCVFVLSMWLKNIFLSFLKCSRKKEHAWGKGVLPCWHAHCTMHTGSGHSRKKSLDKYWMVVPVCILLSQPAQSLAVKSCNADPGGGRRGIQQDSKRIYKDSFIEWSAKMFDIS